MNAAKEIWSLKIRHEYAKNGVACWGEIRLSGVSKELLIRRGCFLQDLKNREWRLLCFSEEKEVFMAEDKLELEFFDRSGYMARKTEYPWKPYKNYPLIQADVSKDTVIDMRKQPGRLEPCRQLIEFKMIVPLHELDLNRMTVTEVQYAAAYKKLTYYLIPHDGNMNRKLEIVVSNMDIKFEEIVGESLDFGPPGLCFRSSKDVKLTENTNMKATLYEIMDNGIRKPLIQELPSHLSQDSFNTDESIKIVYF